MDFKSYFRLFLVFCFFLSCLHPRFDCNPLDSCYSMPLVSVCTSVDRIVESSWRTALSLKLLTEKIEGERERENVKKTALRPGGQRVCHNKLPFIRLRAKKTIDVKSALIWRQFFENILSPHKWKLNFVTKHELSTKFDIQWSATIQ